MQQLWSPWRMPYLRGTDSGNPAGCIFCDLPAQDADADNFIVRRGRHVYVILNRYPYNNGHMMIVPYAHVPSFEQLDAPALAELMALSNETLAALRNMYHPQAFNLGANIGAAAGAGIADHVHMHVVPRWAGDTNFMATVAGTRVIPEDLAETYRLACQHWPAPAGA
ncbi:MAG: HIT domain-containing protein [Anaerolineales bacterium]|nr:HIT domain-containing protein [Anaerolineales bacterium]